MSIFLWLRLFGVVALDVLRWLLEKPVRMVIVGLILLSILSATSAHHWRGVAADRRVQAVAWHGKFSAQKAEMAKLVAVIRAARVEAARLDQVNIRRVQQAWAIQLSEVTHDYQTDLAAARAVVAQRLRPRTGAASHPGGGADAGLPGLPALSTGPVRPGEAAIVDAADIDAVTDNTLRLSHLIDAWTRAEALTASQR